MKTQKREVFRWSLLCRKRNRSELFMYNTDKDLYWFAANEILINMFIFLFFFVFSKNFMSLLEDFLIC